MHAKINFNLTAKSENNVMKLRDVMELVMLLLN